MSEAVKNRRKATKKSGATDRSNFIMGADSPQRNELTVSAKSASRRSGIDVIDLKSFNLFSIWVIYAVSQVVGQK